MEREKSDATGVGQPTQEVNLRVGSVPMTLTIPRSSEVEQALRRAGAQVNKTIEAYRLAFPKVSQVELLSYVALDIANKLQTMELERAQLDLDKRLMKLNRDLEEIF